MGVKIGSTTVAFRLGSSTPAKVAIGSTDVWTSGPTVPSAPTLIGIAVNGTRTLLLQWSAPASDGGAAITGYVISYYTSSGGSTLFTQAVGPEATEYTFDGSLEAVGFEYNASVAAVNSAGTGPSSLFAAATTADPPGTPSWMSASSSYATQGAIDVAFIAPGASGGSAITGYELQYDTANDFSAPQAVSFPETSYTLSGLQGGSSYYLRLRATNAAGSSEWVNWPSNPAAASAAAPGVPTGFSVLPDYANNEWDCSWTEPGNGGSSITEYDIEESDADLLVSTNNTLSGSGSSYSFAVTVPDQTRKFRIRAVNSIGNGAWSEWLSVTHDTPTVPGAPTILSAYYDGNTSQTVVNYSAPADDGNSGITAYTVYIDGVAETPASVLSGTHLFNADYTGQDATVTATNAVGEGAASDPAEVQPA